MPKSKAYLNLKVDGIDVLNGSMWAFVMQAALHGSAGAFDAERAVLTVTAGGVEYEVEKPDWMNEDGEVSE